MGDLEKVIKNLSNVTGYNREDIDAFTKACENYMDDLNELNETIYMYMRSYITGNLVERELYLDEIENITNIREHEDILKIINLKEV